ncbi:MAG: ABC transporter permease subunit [Lachnospiraceae bacterium]|nr:ABC transporter permease subunit [Lachnospiraceae bacterium]
MEKDGTFEKIATKWELTDCICLGKEGTDDAYLLDAGQPSVDEDTRFVVGFDAAFPPYGYKDESGEYVGFDLDLAEEVCKRNGWELVKQPIDWDSKDMELDTGNIDCIWNGFTINGREGDYTWSKAYVDNSQVVIVKKDSGISKLSDLEGKVVIVQADSSALAAFTGDGATDANKELADSFAGLQQVADYNSAFMNLESGSADAICMDIGVAAYQIKERGDNFVMLDERVSSEQYGVGFKKGNTSLRDKVVKTLDAMKEDGKFDEIATKWELTDSVCLGNPGTDSAYLRDANGNKDTGNDKEKLGFGEVVEQIGEGMLASLGIFGLTILFSMPLGLIVCFARMSKFKPISWLARGYISIMRGTPLMLQLLVVFFGPYYVFGTTTSSNYRFYAVIIGFSINYAAYFAEIYRAGIENIPVGQREAALVLGYSKGQTFRKIIFPQMVKRVIPPVTNEVITLVKDTSLAFAIAYTEMFTMAKQVAAAEASIMPLFVAGLFYYVFNFVVALVMELVEKKMQYFN